MINDGTPSEIAVGLFVTSASTLLTEGIAQADEDKAELLRQGLLAGKQLRFVTTMPPVAIAVYLFDGIIEPTYSPSPMTGAAGTHGRVICSRCCRNETERGPIEISTAESDFWTRLCNWPRMNRMRIRSTEFHAALRVEKSSP